MYTEGFCEYLIKKRNLSQTSAKAYVGDVQRFLSFAAEECCKDLTDITESDIYIYINRLRRDKVSAATVTRRIAAIRAYFTHLVGEGICEVNPLENVKLSAPDRHNVEYLTIEETERLLAEPDDSAKGVRDRALLEILYGTGMGIGELVASDLDDMNLKMGFLTCGKGSRERIVPLGRHARKALEDYVYHVRSPQLSKNSEEQALFINTSGGRLSRQGVWKLLKKYGEKAGLEKKITPNILKNSFAIHMLNNGADIRTLRDLMGQDTITAVQAYLESSRPRIKDVYDRTHPRA